MKKPIKHSERAQALQGLDIGCLFYAENPVTGAALTCMATAVSASVIRGHRITTQVEYAFDRRTGQKIVEEGGTSPTTILSVIVLPPDVQDILLEVDQKYRTRDSDHKLTTRHWTGLMAAQDLYRANPPPIE